MLSFYGRKMEEKLQDKMSGETSDLTDTCLQRVMWRSLLGLLPVLESMDHFLRY